MFAEWSATVNKTKGSALAQGNPTSFVNLEILSLRISLILLILPDAGER